MKRHFIDTYLQLVSSIKKFEVILITYKCQKPRKIEFQEI